MALLSPHDDDDLIYEHLSAAPAGFYLAELPNEYSLRSSSLIARNQGERPTCVAFAVAMLYQLYNNRIHGNMVEFSPEWVYQHRINRNSHGMYAKDALKIIQSTGIVLEEDYPYNLYDLGKAEIIERSDVRSAQLLSKAKQNRIAAFSRVSTQDGVKRALLENNTPLVALIQHYKNKPKFWKKTRKETPSHHAVLITGYNPSGLEIMNSWGENWMDAGFSVIPWKYWKRISEIWSAY